MLLHPGLTDIDTYTMGGITKCEIHFDHTHAVYTAGDTVTGQVQVELDGAMQMNLKLRLYGMANVTWENSTGSRLRIYRANEFHLDHSENLFGGDNDASAVIQPAGYVIYNFQVQIPSTCPSSFEGERGYVRYLCRAMVETPGKTDYIVKSAFTVVGLLDLNLEPNIGQSLETEESTEVSCCGFKSGTISATFGIDKRGYVPGENIIINAEIRNTSNDRIEEVKVVLKQHTNFYGRCAHETEWGPSEPTPKSTSEVVAKMTRYKIRPRETSVWDNVRLRVPPVPPSRLVGCRIIDVSYEVKLSILSWTDLKLAFNVTIGTIPLRQVRQAGGSTQPSAPLSDDLSITSPVYIDAPPPSYEECVKGQRYIKDLDTDNTPGLHWAPSYPTYNWSTSDANTCQ